MLGQVRQLIENNYVIEMKKKDAEFMALQEPNCGYFPCTSNHF